MPLTSLGTSVNKMPVQFYPQHFNPVYTTMTTLTLPNWAKKQKAPIGLFLVATCALFGFGALLLYGLLLKTLAITLGNMRQLSAGTICRLSIAKSQSIQMKYYAKYQNLDVLRCNYLTEKKQIISSYYIP